MTEVWMMRVFSAKLEVAVASRDWVEAQRCATQAVEVWREGFRKRPDAHHKQLLAAGLPNLGECSGYAGGYEEACQYLGLGLRTLYELVEREGHVLGPEHLMIMVEEGEDALRFFQSMRAEQLHPKYVPFVTTEIDP